MLNLREKKEKKREKKRRFEKNDADVNLISSFSFLIYNLLLSLIFTKMFKIYTYNYF